MSDSSAEVVIVDAMGTEHHFPAGFDPIKAAAIVKKTLQPPNTFATRNPRTAAVIGSAANALPAAGAIIGGVVASPETLGAGSLAGAALGAGAGRGARDLITEGLGIEPVSSPMQKAGTIALDTAVTAAVPGAVQAARAPVRTLAEFANAARKVIPRAFQPEFMRHLPAVIKAMDLPAMETTPLVRPQWQSRIIAAPPQSVPSVTAQLEQQYQMLAKKAILTPAEQQQFTFLKAAFARGAK